MVNGSFAFDKIEHVLLELDVGDAVGSGYAFAFEPHQAEAIRAMVIDLVEPLVGTPVANVRAIWADLWRRLNYIGQAGPPIMALAVVDTAIWDLLAQRAEVPLYQYLDGTTDSVPVYATGGWLSYSKEELVEEAERFRARQVAGYKMKVGHPDWRVDVDRVEHVRAAIGDDMQLLVDANQAWGVSEAIAAGRALGELGVTWLEEPVVAQDVDGCARVSEALEVAVATGESVFTRYGFIPLIERGAADVLMPDVTRCGGPTEFLEVAALADAQQIPISSHAFTEISAHLMAACPNASMVEWIPGWSDALFDRPLGVADGRLSLPRGPGLGVRYSAKAIRDYSVDGAAGVQILGPGLSADVTPGKSEGSA